MVKIKRKPIHFNHEEIYYVPVFQKDFNEDGSLNSYPTFVHSMTDATTDEQMAYSCNPDYVLVLKGTFDATTKPIEIEDEEDEA